MTYTVFNDEMACPQCFSIPCLCKEVDEEEARACRLAEIERDRILEEEEEEEWESGEYTR